MVNVASLCRFFADLLIGHMQDLAAAEVIELHSVFGDDETATHHRRLHQHFQGTRAVGPPLQKDNWANLTETCILEDEVEEMIKPGQASHLHLLCDHHAHSLH